MSQPRPGSRTAGRVSGIHPPSTRKSSCTGRAGHNVKIEYRQGRRGAMTTGTAHVWILTPDGELILSDVITWLRCLAGRLETTRPDGTIIPAGRPGLPARLPPRAAPRAGVPQPLARRPVDRRDHPRHLQVGKRPCGRARRDHRPERVSGLTGCAPTLLTCGGAGQLRLARLCPGVRRAAAEPVRGPGTRRRHAHLRDPDRRRQRDRRSERHHQAGAAPPGHAVTRPGIRYRPGVLAGRDDHQVRPA